MTTEFKENLLDVGDADRAAEVKTILLDTGQVRIERIVSFGQASPPGFWYDQQEREWVSVLRGSGVVQFEDGREVELGPGQFLCIEPHERHRVAETKQDEPTVWLAVLSSAL